MKTIEFIPQNVCSRRMIITIDGDIIKHIEIYSGCDGNKQAICKLVEGYTINEVISKLEGIKCRGSKTGLTSCPDQLCQALKQMCK